MATPAPRMSSTFMSFDISQDAEANTASVELPDDTMPRLDEQGRPMSGKIWDGAWGTWRDNLIGPSNKSEKQIMYNLAGWWDYILPNAQQYAPIRLQARRMQEKTWDTTTCEQIVQIRNYLRGDQHWLINESGGQVLGMIDQFIISKGLDPKDYGRVEVEEETSSSEEMSVEDMPMPRFGGIKRTLDDDEDMDARLKRLCVEMDKVRGLDMAACRGDSNDAEGKGKRWDKGDTGRCRKA